MLLVYKNFFLSTELILLWTNALTELFSIAIGWFCDYRFAGQIEPQTYGYGVYRGCQARLLSFFLPLFFYLLLSFLLPLFFYLLQSLVPPSGNGCGQWQSSS